MTALGIPESRLAEAKQEYAKAALRRVGTKALDRIERRPSGDVGGWVGISDEEVEAILAGQVEAGPTILPRTDGQCLLYAGRTNTIVGRRGAGKTWVALRACAEVLDAGGQVLYLDMEDTSAAWRQRMKDLGVDIDAAIRERRAVWKKPPDVPEDIEAVVEWMGGFDLVVFDVVNRLITRLGGTPDNGNSEVLWLYDNLFDPLAQRHGTCVLLLDHPNKRGQRLDITSLDDLQPGGGAMRMNNASGIVLGMWPRKPFTRDDPSGHVTLYCLKDRSGRFEEGQPAGELHGGIGVSDTTSTLTFELRIEPPDTDVTDDLAVELDKVQRRILKLLATAPMKRRDLDRAITARLRHWIGPALDQLVEDGEVGLDDDGRYSVTGGRL